MGSITNILVPIKDCSARALPAVDKAAQLAAALGARMELFHDIATAIPVEALQKAESTLRGIKTEMRQTALSGLERLAAPLRKRGIVVSVAAVWDYPPYEAIVRRAVARPWRGFDRRAASRPASSPSIAGLYRLGALTIKSGRCAAGQNLSVLSPAAGARSRRSHSCACEAKHA
jgi:hypothetical protein